MAARRGLWVANGLAGVTQPADARLALGGLLSHVGPNPLDVGAGVLAGPGTPCQVTGVASGPNMKYSIAAGVLATVRGTSTDGVYLWANDGAYTADSLAPAPSSGTRWDLIWGRAKNANDGFGDANSDPEFGVTVGTSGATPSKPYGSVPAGALVLAESSVPTSAPDASTCVITQVAPWKVLSGAPTIATLLFTPGSATYTPDAGTATWVTLGNITVPSWATQCTVVYSMNGIFDTGASTGNATAVLKIGSQSGAVNKRLLEPGSSNQRFTDTRCDVVTGLTAGSKSVTIAATWVGGTHFAADAQSFFTAQFTFLP